MIQIRNILSLDLSETDRTRDGSRENGTTPGCTPTQVVDELERWTPWNATSSPRQLADARFPVHHLVVRRVGALMTVVVAVACVDAAKAAACTRDFTFELVEPGHGSTDVPTNVVPWFRSNGSASMVETGVPGPVDGGVPGIVLAIVDGEGAEVPADAIVHAGALGSSAVELRPRAELRPFTHYWIVAHVNGAMEQSVFETGDGPVETAPTGLGDLSMQVSSTLIHSSCGENTIACVPLPGLMTVHATITRADTVEAQTIFRGSETFQLSRQESARSAPFCIELRARDLAGQLGPLSSICSSQVESFDVRSTASPSCAGVRPRWGGEYAEEIATEGGCSSARARDAPWPLALAALLLATQTPRTRRRRRSR